MNLTNFMKYNKILITGGGGYLGSVLCPLLLDEGYEVTILDNFLYNQSSLLDCCNNKNLTIIRGDVRDKETVENALKSKDIIIHLAAIVGAPACDLDPNRSITTNLEATKLILSLRTQEQKILFPCTNSGYGIGEKNKFCTEKTPMNPISLYGKNKVESEKIILESGNSLSFRFATVFGVSPRMRLDLLVNDFVYRAVNDKFIIIFEGDFKRNYIHIRDVARVFLHGIKNFDEMKGESYNVGLSDANLSKNELCKKIKLQIPEFVFLESSIGEDPDKRDYIVSNEKIERTGFYPKYTLEDGIEELVKCYKIVKSNDYRNF